MATAPSYLDRKGSMAVRSSVAAAGIQPQSPHTPQRPISSNFSSPGAGYRAEDDYVVIEIGSRYVHAGFAGDAKPRCAIAIGQDGAYRAGDYRRWLPGRETEVRPRHRIAEWASHRELWQMDTRNLDLNLVEDKLERAVREAYTKYLLLDTKSRKVLLALPSVLPHALINTILTIFFVNFHVPTVVMLPSPTLSVLAAGQRSGTVVDIGWHETIITSVYEFREIRQDRSIRAMRLTTLKMGQLLGGILRHEVTDAPPKRTESTTTEDEKMELEFDFVEDITSRLSWCECERKHGSQASADRDSSEREMGQSNDRMRLTVDHLAMAGLRQVAVDRRGSRIDSPKCLEVPIREFQTPVESALILQPDAQRDQDDEELSIPCLLYRSFQTLPPDVRAICLSNIIFAGGGSNIPGLKARILNELSQLIVSEGWSPIRSQNGRRGEHGRRQTKEDWQLHSQEPPSTAAEPVESRKRATQFHQERLVDQALATAQSNGSKSEGTWSVSGIRSVTTLGPWSGASLAANMRLKGVVEIERDSFLLMGLAGARSARDWDTNAARSRQSLGPGLARAGVGEGTPWTLGTWA